MKALVLCDDISDKPDSGDQKHLQGAGLSRIECVDPFPVKPTFWALKGVYFVELWYDGELLADQRLEIV